MSTTSDRRHLWSHWPVLSSVVGTIGLVVLFWNLPVVIGLSDWAAHAVSHLAVGIPAALLLVVALRLWPPPSPTRLARIGRTALLWGLALLAAAQLIEAVSARVEYPTMGPLHTWSGMASILALLLVATASLLSAGAMVGGRLRLGRPGRAILIVLAAALVAFVLFGLVGGFALV